MQQGRARRCRAWGRAGRGGAHLPAAADVREEGSQLGEEPPTQGGAAGAAVEPEDQGVGVGGRQLTLDKDVAAAGRGEAGRGGAGGRGRGIFPGEIEAKRAEACEDTPCAGSALCWPQQAEESSRRQAGQRPWTLKRNKSRRLPQACTQYAGKRDGNDIIQWARGPHPTHKSARPAFSSTIT